VTYNYRSVRLDDGSTFEEKLIARCSKFIILSIYEYETNVVFGAPESLTAFGVRTFLVMGVT
jgi:hypothetical protein